jgi:CRISPR system Cascade subunit CasA
VSERFSYSLIEEPWIPCEQQDGTIGELGIGPLLVQAHQLRAIAAPSPLTTAALHRLLLAVLHRCFGPSDLDEWEALYRAGRFDGDRIGEYLEKWKGRFDLFDEQHPFYQVPGLSLEPRPAFRLEIERSIYGSAVHLFEHRPDDAPTSLGPAEGARALVTLQAFHLGGLMSRAKGEKPSAAGAPLAKAAMVLVLGDNLFETLMFNLLTEEHRIRSSEDDAPAWEREPAKLGKGKPKGWLDWLTWQSRRLRLIPERIAGEVRIREGIVAGGMDLETEHRDPMVAWRTHEKQGFVPVRFEQGREVWRDSNALFRLKARDAEAPRACEQLASLGGRIAERVYRISLFGQDNQQAQVLLQQSETMPLPLALLRDDDLVDSLSVALQQEAEKTAKALGSSLWRLAEEALSPGFDPVKETGRKPQRQDVNKLLEATGAMQRFWSSVRPAFDTLLLDLPKDRDAARRAWRNALRRCALRTFNQAAEGIGESAGAWKGAAMGERRLLGRLSRILPTDEKEGAEE